MHRKMTNQTAGETGIHSPSTRFFTETVEVGRISPLMFFEAGASEYDTERFYWQNADKTLTLAGIGHAAVLQNDLTAGRYEDIAAKWKQLCGALIKEEEDVDPVLFGGFSFDPKNTMTSEWDAFPSAYFVVPSFQLKTEMGRTTVSINMITSEPNAAEAFERMREERDRLIHDAQLSEFDFTERHELLSIAERNKDEYMQAVKSVTAHIKQGIADKVVIARSLKLSFDAEVSKASVLHAISNEQAESYHFGLCKDDYLFFGATPERLIEIKDGRVFSACVAGSTPRGKSAAEDKALGAALLSDSKNREEHQFVVGMISDVFHEHCKDVAIPKTPKLMKIRDIQHLYTSVEGTVSEQADIFQFVKELHPTPALGGVPTGLAMEMIRHEEQMDRGYYAAPVGYTDTSGNGEFAVAIRSALLHKDNAYLYAGGGIVADSDADQEYEETWVKFRPVLRALGGKVNG